MSIVSIKNLTKTYPSFQLDKVSFSLEAGRIAGFIGRNGAGKTTTIKSMLNLVHPDNGEIEYFGLPFLEHEAEIKKRIGYSTGTVNWYPRKKIKEIVDVTKKFYDSWDDDSYRKYLRMFKLDEEKTPLELSEGMKVKVNLMLALSHKAEVLILDEPTSGLDPFSRDELMEIFIKLKNEGVAIFFSTHIITDIERCADNIIYISKGKIVDASSKDTFKEKYTKDGENLEDAFLRMERGED
ncbi:ABC-2 type transport system ATP-binding protein [Lachnospiraceae bacterium RM5]|nr:ABC-2 type transport system ATP-binding protein [Lachnospiraceae bacterium RM5]